MGSAKVAFVLGGGGVLGAVQVGMLRALSAHGIRPDLVVGQERGVDAQVHGDDARSRPAPVLLDS